MSSKQPGESSSQRNTRGLLADKVQNALQRALRDDGSISADDLAVLTRLVSLDRYQKSLTDTRRPRWPLAVAFILTLSIVSVLVFVRVPETEIELRVSVTDLTFQVPRQAAATELLQLSTFVVSGAESLEAPGIQRALQTGNPAGSDMALKVADAGGAATITLEPLIAAAGTVIEIRIDGPPYAMGISLDGPGQETTASAHGRLSIHTPGHPAADLEIKTPKVVTARGTSDGLRLDLSLIPSWRGAIAQQVPAGDLSLMRIERYGDIDRALIRKTSAIREGTLYFESLNGKSRALRPGEALRLQKAAGIIRHIVPEGDQMVLVFNGRVEGIQSGHGARVNLMPSYLEWLLAQHALSLFWFSTLYVFGLAVAALRWWGTAL